MQPYRFFLLFLTVWVIASTHATAQSVAQTVAQREVLCRAADTAAEVRLSACGSLIEGAVYTNLSDYAVTHFNRGMALAQTGALEAAMTDLDTALDYDPYFYQAYIQRGTVLLSRDEPYRAILDFSVAAGLDPLIAEPYANRALALFANKEYAAALKDLETALKFDPTNTAARRSLAWMLSVVPDKTLRDGPRAISLIDGGQQAQTDQVVFAAAQAESGDIDGALQTYQVLAGQDPRAAQRFQTYLMAAGYYQGPIDGKFSPELEAALKQCLQAGCRIGGPMARP
ncbi:MAG: hypothetical protein CMM78_11805 [Rhodospirillaceae bacterium]|jgi:tetratricopeptide (TPR) repeat protein|uniref:tetratricopeptide repeat protein n=1 Tax=Hwanghaeella sp. 1Z406 TaxID=3402811 RepID=UPI000C68E6B8|nr:hypothetical protein [Rhodospirillales bacterium]MAX48885.1 hypothetical protein [Rhodospirillaceae bacterium]|tara:strand:+ start:37126 stop:37980 length:855 start_codon:yes stop_codon:yes gene_type:complete